MLDGDLNGLDNIDRCYMRNIEFACIFKRANDWGNNEVGREAKILYALKIG